MGVQTSSNGVFGCLGYMLHAWNIYIYFNPYMNGLNLWLFFGKYSIHGASGNEWHKSSLQSESKIYIYIDLQCLFQSARNEYIGIRESSANHVCLDMCSCGPVPSLRANESTPSQNTNRNERATSDMSFGKRVFLS